MGKEWLDFIKKKPCTKEELLRYTSLEAIQESCDKGEIVWDKGKYFWVKNLHWKLGKIISVKKHYAFVSFDETEGYIDKKNLHGALWNDEVFIKGFHDGRRIQYEVMKIFKRNPNPLVGTLIFSNKHWYLEVEDVAPIHYRFLVNEEEIPLYSHHVVLFQILSYSLFSCQCQILKDLGSSFDEDMDLKKVLYKNQIDLSFPEEVEEELKNIPKDVQKEDYEKRMDFREHLIFTIDGEKAKDFDDAVEVLKENENIKIGVHIADVSYYIKENSNIDLEARKRSTSIYYANKVIPMLPFEISNGICSLNPDVDRLTQSVYFEITPQGEIVSAQLFKGIIHSKARLTYEKVNEYFKTKKKSLFSKEIIDALELLQKATILIKKKREKEGRLNISSEELEFQMDENGKILDVKRKEAGIGEAMIEECMICANEIIAKILHENHFPAIYRIHERPQAKKIEDWMDLSSLLSYPCSFSSLTITSKQIQKHLQKIKDPVRYKILSYFLLRSLSKAKYDITPIGHFGLALQDYTHFTSPIRRYPDLMVHRILDIYFFKGEKQKKITEEYLSEISEISSVHERRAQNIEREMDTILSAKYMERFIGSSFQGIVMNMNSNGMFLELENGIVGFLPFSFVGHNIYYDEEEKIALSRRGVVQKLGDQIEVILEFSDPSTGQIIFSLPMKKKKNKIK